MGNSVKVMLYAVLVLLASVSGYFALTNFGQMMSRARDRTSDLEQIEPDRKPAADMSETNPAVATASSTNASGTNAAAAATTNTLSTNGAVAAASQTTNAPVPASPKAEEVPTALSGGAKHSEVRGGHVAVWTALFVVTVIGLGLLMASDISHYVGNRALKVLYNDEGEGAKDPEYDQAEEVWANGQHLEAIKMMRDYLAKNPREQHVAIRIAEIYEKDLNNNLAAALEYEEVLKQKLAPERWGWAAIHLCNLYFRLNQEQKAHELLRRVVNEYPNTAAAEKARKRLEQVDGAEMPEQIAIEKPVSADPKGNASAPAEPAPPAPASNLPPGFRPKK